MIFRTNAATGPGRVPHNLTSSVNRHRTLYAGHLDPSKVVLLLVLVPYT